jgi:hypothetical protein
MKGIIFIVIATLIGFKSYSQDTIVKKSGEKIICEIEKEDSTKVYITIQRNNRDIYTYIEQSDIVVVKYYNEQIQNSNRFDRLSLGLGLGLDYGGIGWNLLLYPQKNIGIFGGLGIVPTAGVGVNGGAKLRFFSDYQKHKIIPYCVIMYGYNAAIVIKDAEEYNKFFYGPTLGIGIDIKAKQGKKHYWSLALLLPIRGTKVDDYIEDLESNHNVEFNNKLIPIGISIGYRFY